MRGLWFVAGAGAGVYAMIRGRRAAEALTADGLQDRWGAVTLGARMIRDEVAQGRAEAETDLRARLGLVPSTTAELEAPTRTSPEISSPEISTDEEGTH